MSLRFISKDIINIAYFKGELTKSEYIEVFEAAFKKDFKVKLSETNDNYIISNGYLDVFINKNMQRYYLCSRKLTVR